MDKEKIALMKSRIEEQISKIDNKDFTLYFYVIDTKGVPSGSLAYIYDIAFGLKEMGYNVAMMHSEEEFVGVEEWLGKDYAELTHYNVEKKSVDITPSDILFIPEVYSNVMTATRKLPCQRVAILQSFEKLTEFIPFGASWMDLGIFKAITTTETNAKRLNKYFPAISVDVIKPKVSKVFTKPEGMKKLMVNIVTRNQSDVNRIVKPFFWQYPMYQWVAFREVRGLSREDFSKALQEAAITVWVDDTTDFGYIPLEAMKCGSIVIGKAPESVPEWMWSEEDNVLDLTRAGIWVDNFENLPSVLASVIRTWTMDEIPSNIQETADELVSKYTEGSQLQDIKNVIIDKYINGRREEYIATLETLNNNENKE
jgi:glycosyltransferase involved in cell wall biosynthesis